MANSAFASGFNTDALFVAAKAATIYAAHEQSLFLGGGMIPVVNAPNGLLQVPELAAVAATTLTSEASTGVDLDSVLSADTKNVIQCDIFAARSVLRDLGNIDPSEIGRVLGNSVSKAFDTAVVAAMNGLTASTSDSDPMTVDALFDAVAQIRGNGETGPLMGVVSTVEAANLMKAIGTAAYGGGDFQSEAMRNGFLGQIAGVRLFQSSYVTGTNKGFIFAGDAMRIAMQQNVGIETARRPEAVGQDIVASLHAGVGVIDAGRGVKLINV
jgi:hypothetical protein|tara:strand:- start:21 stop:830 length:810 start_codon:yes stop_codon:yes gene_type:complete